MTRVRGIVLAAVALCAVLAGCSGSPHAAPGVRRAHTAPEGVNQTIRLRFVHSPGHVIDDMHLQPGACHAREAADGDPLPDRTCTPGAVDPAVTQATIRSTICVHGWTATVRPPSSDTGRWKLDSEADYGVTATFVGELDHLVPLELGGANSTSNLWPEPGAIPNAKDVGPERHLHDDVCAGRMTLRQAQQEIAKDWTTATW